MVIHFYMFHNQDILLLLMIPIQLYKIILINYLLNTLRIYMIMLYLHNLHENIIKYLENVF